MPNGYFATVALASATGETADTTQNTWAMDTGVDDNWDDPQFAAWGTALIAFYEELKNGGVLCGTARIGHLIKFYRATTALGNFPRYEAPFSFATPPAAVDLPREVALCISFRNSQIRNVARGRLRGRLFIMGFGETQNTGGRPTTGVIGTLSAAYFNYYSRIAGIQPGGAPAVFSRTDETCYPIDEAWVDNEWDTQRRRGTKPTERNEITLP